jgi:hypothetical protein
MNENRSIEANENRISLSRYIFLEQHMEDGLDRLRRTINDASGKELDYIQHYLYKRYYTLLRSINKKGIPIIFEFSGKKSEGTCLGYCIKMGPLEHIQEIGKQLKTMKLEEDKKEFLEDTKRINTNFWKIMELCEKEYDYWENKIKETCERP